MSEQDTIVDPLSDKTVRFTDNGMKDGDLPGIDPDGKSFAEIIAEVRELAGVDIDDSE